MKVRYLFLFTLFLMTQSNALAQIEIFKKPDPEKDSIVGIFLDTFPRLNVIGRYNGENIQLRWAPTTAEMWRRYNKGGYTILRYWRDSTTNNSGLMASITPDTIKPWSINKFETYFKQPNPDNYVGVVGQTIYGAKPTKDQIKHWLDKVTDEDNRHNFTLLSADYSQKAAEAAGLYFEDTDVQPNRYYYYLLIGHCNIPNVKDTVELFVNTFEVENTPIPIISNINVNYGAVELRLIRDYHNKFFSGYFIERSEDGKTFKEMNSVPFVNPITESLPVDLAYITYKDTTVVQGTNYYYRIKGITSFGQHSNYSEIVHAILPDKTPPSQPFNVVAKHLGGTRVELTWEHDGNEPDLGGFMVGRSRLSHEGFENVSGEKPLTKSTRKFIDENCSDKTTNFYIVAAVDTLGNGSASLVSFASILDTFPPSKPTGLKGDIDTSGRVTLKWNLGIEDDIKGYLVHFTNDKNHTFTCLTGQAIQDTMWSETITLHTLTKKIYYRIQAVDIVDNVSHFSEILELTKPDIVPPVKPFIHAYNVEIGKIHLEYQPSSSPDVEYHLFRRKSLSNPKWEDLKRINDRQTQIFIDESIAESTEYWYTVIAVDSAGNVSDEATPIKLKTLRDLSNPIKNIEVVFDTLNKIITLNWKDLVDKNYKEIIIYKSQNKGPVLSQTRVVALPGETNKYVEKNIDPKQNYEYTTKVVFDKGVISGFGPLTEAKLK